MKDASESPVIYLHCPLLFTGDIVAIPPVMRWVFLVFAWTFISKEVLFLYFCFNNLVSCVCRYDSEKDNYIDLMELKLMMEKLGAPQTHLGLKNMIKEVDEDLDGKLSFREVNASVCQNMKLFLYQFGCFTAMKSFILYRKLLLFLH